MVYLHSPYVIIMAVVTLVCNVPTISLSREQACQLTSLYEVQDSTFTDAGIGTGDNSRLPIQPGHAAVN